MPRRTSLNPAAAKIRQRNRPLRESLGVGTRPLPTRLPTPMKGRRVTPLDEVLDAISGEIARCAARARDHAASIEGAGALVTQLTAEVFRDAAPRELLQRAQGIQCIVLRGMTSLAELYREAGRLEELATLRLVADANDDR